MTLRPMLFVAGLAALASPAAAQQEANSVSQSEIPAPPVAEQRPHSFTMHGVTVEDPYFWLKDQSYPVIDDEDVLDYVRAENAYYEAVMAPHQALSETIFEEMKGRIPQEDASVPVRDGAWEYWYAYDEGLEYRKWYRRPVGGGPDELLLDENVLAEGQEHFDLGALDVSPDGRLFAYSTDTDGSERYVMRVRDIAAGEDLGDEIPETNGGVVWAADSGSFVYTPVNENWRTQVAMHHILGSDPADDREIHREEDQRYQLGIDETQSERFLLISSGDNVTNEVRLVPRDDLSAEPILVSPRIENRQYSVEERDGTLYILTNDDHVNFRLVTAPVETPGDWTELRAGSDDFYLTGMTTFEDFYVVEGREQGLDQLEIWRYGGDEPTRVPFPEASYSAGLGPVAEFDVDAIRVDYESMVTPSTDYSYDIATGTLETLKVQRIPSGYDAGQYTTERLMIEARDGTMVPVSLVYRRDTEIGPDTPMHLYAYGAYGYAIPPNFSTRQLSLIDRGFIYAIAHIRGGDDLGYQWYLDGKLEQRTNTFNDFVDVARGLTARGYSSPGRIAISGRSAGGELMGAVLNQAPELWGAVVAGVPFVDVLNTMLDESLPLTPGEWPEWGNPITDPEAFTYIRSYSPYDNIEAKDYPPTLITAGLNDPRVTYWEPAKFAARLRAMRTDDDLTLLRTEMGAGHSGQSGRFQSLREYAEEMAFMLWQLGVEE
ncbi:MAG: S9 family peptidase [Sphingomonadales bacterium]|nr:S9 family peptidase [Sphingomonadales bacterium]